MRGEEERQAGQSKSIVRCLRDALQSKAVTLCFLGMGGLIFGMILAIAGAGRDFIAILFLSYLIIIISWLLTVALLERRRTDRLEKLLEDLPEKYLLGEVLPRPVNSVERRYFQIIKEMSHSTVGIVEQARREKEEYCDYVESWIHEIKTPLTACSLILDNDRDVRRLRRELKRADNLTETILWYARLRTAQKDVKIREFSVAVVIGEAIKSQMELLIGAGIRVEAEGDFTVHSDDKSLCFILKQLLVNCAKYCPGCQVTVRAARDTVSVRDNGPGIPAHELCRVTERGFTGRGGAEKEGMPFRASRSTGMGLYIVKELCVRLGISLKIESRVGEFTCVSLSFDSLARP